jgi:stress response protein YsnF
LRQSAPETAARPDAEPRQVFAPSAAGPLFREDCEVERVQVKRMLDQPAEIRQDGDTLIIPLMEEVLVIEKRLMLREELHIRRRRETKADNDRIPIPSNQLAQ